VTTPVARDGDWVAWRGRDLSRRSGRRVGRSLKVAGEGCDHLLAVASLEKRCRVLCSGRWRIVGTAARRPRRGRAGGLGQELGLAIDRGQGVPRPELASMNRSSASRTRRGTRIMGGRCPWVATQVPGQIGGSGGSRGFVSRQSETPTTSATPRLLRSGCAKKICGRVRCCGA